MRQCLSPEGIMHASQCSMLNCLQPLASAKLTAVTWGWESPTSIRFLTKCEDSLYNVKYVLVVLKATYQNVAVCVLGKCNAIDHYSSFQYSACCDCCLCSCSNITCCTLFQPLNLLLSQYLWVGIPMSLPAWLLRGAFGKTGINVGVRNSSMT